MLSDEDYLAGVEYVRQLVERWEPHRNGSRWYIFDMQVLSLCMATLHEAERYSTTMPKTATAVAP